jgi:hypothetical protein
MNLKGRKFCVFYITKTKKLFLKIVSIVLRLFKIKTNNWRVIDKNNLFKPPTKKCLLKKLKQKIFKIF